VLRLPLRSPVRKFSAPASHPARVCSLWCFHSAISAGSKFLVPTSHPTRVCSLQRSPSAISTGSEFPVPTFHPPRVFLRQRSSSVISTAGVFDPCISYCSKFAHGNTLLSQGVSFISLRLIYSNCSRRCSPSGPHRQWVLRSCSSSCLSLLKVMFFSLTSTVGEIFLSWMHLHAIVLCLMALILCLHYSGTMLEPLRSAFFQPIRSFNVSLSRETAKYIVTHSVRLIFSGKSLCLSTCSVQPWYWYVLYFHTSSHRHHTSGSYYHLCKHTFLLRSQQPLSANVFEAAADRCRGTGCLRCCDKCFRGMVQGWTYVNLSSKSIEESMKYTVNRLQNHPKDNSLRTLFSLAQTNVIYWNKVEL